MCYYCGRHCTWIDNLVGLVGRYCTCYPPHKCAINNSVSVVYQAGIVVTINSGSRVFLLTTQTLIQLGVCISAETHLLHNKHSQVKFFLNIFALLTCICMHLYILHTLFLTGRSFYGTRIENVQHKVKYRFVFHWLPLLEPIARIWNYQ